jgi:hypothetical protein
MLFGKVVMKMHQTEFFSEFSYPFVIDSLGKDTTVVKWSNIEFFFERKILDMITLNNFEIDKKFDLDILKNHLDAFMEYLNKKRLSYTVKNEYLIENQVNLIIQNKTHILFEENKIHKLTIIE